MLDSAGICILGTIIAYLLIVLIIGFHYARKNESASDFYLGGRKLGPLVTDRSCSRNVSELAFDSKAPQKIHTCNKVIYNTTVFLKPLPR